MMIPVSIYSVVFIFIIASTQIFWARSLMELVSTPIKLLAFSLAQTTTVALLSYIMPLHGLRFILQAVTNITFQMWIFKANLFPEALFGAIAPLLLAFLGELFVPQLCLIIFGPSSPWSTLWGITQEPFAWTAFLPSIILAAYFFCKPRAPKTVHRAVREMNHPFGHGFLRAYGFILPLVLLHQIFTICICNHNSLKEHIFGQAFFYAGALMLPVVCITLIHYIRSSEHDQRVINYHAEKSRIQDSAIRVLREERHDFLNELTLISSYVQMRKWEEAESCIAYAAASLADRYNYATLPHDAWLTVLEFKQKEAQRRLIDFEVRILSDPPQDYIERRLLPKLIINLVDNAFTAASQSPDPRVRLQWCCTSNGTRALEVANNGHPIPPHLTRKIFKGGFSSKKDPSGNNGWGLVICEKIAAELGGKLTFESTAELTKFILTLPSTASTETQAKGAFSAR